MSPPARADPTALVGPPDVVGEMVRVQQQRIFLPPKTPLSPGQHLDPIRIDLPTLRLDNGLPDVAVQDLAIFSRGPIRLLRAATQARGVWELDLAGPVTDRTYVRVHQYDTRRTLPTTLTAPFEPKIADPADATKQIETRCRWHASPDLRVHPTLGPMAAPTSLPWTRAHPAGTPADRFGFWRLWRLQAALRRDDLRSEATGVWDAQFDAVLRANAVPTPGGTTITKAYWESTVTGANLTRFAVGHAATHRGRPGRVPPRGGEPVR